MTGIQVHTQEPISPAKASGVSPQTADKPVGSSSQTASITTAASHGYPPAKPGAAVPTPTATSKSTYSPPAPQPGAAPIPPPPTTTTKPSLPPPPKAGEKPMPPGYYAPVHSTATKLQPYPPQMAQPPLGSYPNGIPPRSTISTTEPSFPLSAPPINLPAASAGSPSRASLEHPPGYVQNPYASDMTPAQRLAASRRENESETSPSLGITNNANGNHAGSGEEESVWSMTTKWARKKGEQASELHGQVWEKIDELSKGR